MSLHLHTATVHLSSWQHLPGLIHGMQPISHSACATHVFLFNLLDFSCSAITRTLPAIFFPALYKRITDVKIWNRLSRSLSSRPVLRLACDNLCTRSLFSLRFHFPEGCPSLVCYVGDKMLRPFFQPVLHVRF